MFRNVAGGTRVQWSSINLVEILLDKGLNKR